MDAKLVARLQALGQTDIPCPSTITAILRRHNRLNPQESAQHKAWQRFEHPLPNDLWQMVFKGHVAMRDGRCHPLTVLDDHSRYAVCLRACLNEQTATVQAALTDTFRRYGLPWRMTSGSRYFCESLFWASQPKQAAKITRPLMPSAPQPS